MANTASAAKRARQTVKRTARNRKVKVGVKAELHTVPGGKHGGFSAPENVAVYGAIRQFLSKYGLPVK